MHCVNSTAGSFFISCKIWKSLKFFGPRQTFISFCSQQNEVHSDPIVDNLKLDIDEEEIEKKRFKARLDEKVYSQFIKKEFPPLVNKHHFTKKHLRKMYGRWGAESGLNPGIAWPTREELLEMIEYDKMFRTSLREMLDNIESAEREKMREILEYEAEVDKNMAKLETYKKEYFAKIEKKEQAIRESKLRNEQRIQQIRELLGYDVDPKDPKFQEALEMIRKEEKKAKKAKKQQESYEKILSKLASVEAGSKKAASKEQAETAHAATETPDDNCEEHNSQEVPK